MTRRELLRLIGVAPLGAAAAGLGIEAVARRFDPWASEVMAAYGTDHPDVMTASEIERRWFTLRAKQQPSSPVIDAWLDETGKAMHEHLANLPPASWRTFNNPATSSSLGKWREEWREVAGVGNSGRELTSPPLRGGDPPSEEEKKLRREEVGKLGVQPTPPGESAGGSLPGRASGRDHRGGGK